MEFRHHSLSAFVIDAQVQCDPTMTIGRMLAVHCFDLSLERQVFVGHQQPTIDVLAVDAQRLGADGLAGGLTHYFDFF